MFVIPYVGDWVVSKLRAWKQSRDAKTKREDEARADREKMEKAQTPQEREESAKSTIGSF